jgi:plasmid maintenance system killer protein
MPVDGNIDGRCIAATQGQTRVINSFRNRQTETLFRTGAARAVPPDIQRRAFLLLRQLNAASQLQDMASPPGNRLEKLGGDRAGSYFRARQPAVAHHVSLD